MTRDRDTFDMFAPRDRGRFGDNEMAEERAPSSSVTGSSDIRDFDMVLHAETHPGDGEKGAYLVSVTGEEDRATWIPKSLAELERKGHQVDGITRRAQLVKLDAVRISIPQWVAKEKGLI